MEPRILLLGELNAEGGRFQFRPAPTRFEARAGDDLLFGVKYRYEEAGGGKEETQIVLTVELDGVGPRRADVRIGDTPGVHDTAWGFLNCGARMPRSGLITGKFFIQAFWKEAGWVGGKKTRNADFRHEATFEVNVA